MTAAAEDKKRAVKVRHAHYILGYIASPNGDINYGDDCGGNDGGSGSNNEGRFEDGDVTIQCCDGDVSSHGLLLAALSPLLREYLEGVEATAREPLVVVPTLRAEEVNILFAYVFAKERYRPQEFPSLFRACRVLGVPLDRLPRELLQYSDGDHHDTDPESTVVPMILPESIEVREVEASKVDVAGKRRRGRPRKQPEKDDDIDERGAKSSSSASLPPPPPSKRCRGAREGRIFSYSSFGRPRRSTARSGAGLGEEMTSDDQRDDDDEDLMEASPERQSALAQEPETFPCAFCSRTYAHIKAKNRHMLVEHAEECEGSGMYFKCDQCPQVFISASGRVKHVMRVHNSRGIPVVSSAPFTDNREAPDNIVIDPETGTHRVKCPFQHRDGAVILVRTVKDFRDHISIDHPDKEKCCLICAKPFGTKGELVEHLQTHSGPEGDFLFTCDHCRRRFLSEYSLIAHKRDEHSVNELWSCRHCGKQFRNAKFCKNHEKKHETGEISEENQFVCQYTVDEGKGEQVQCGRSFSNRHNLERHTRSHTGAKSHACDLCGKTFVDSTRLKRHKWIHAGHNPYKCNECDAGFRHLSHLKSHEVTTHGAEKPFECEFCEKGFVYAYQLKTHLAAHAAKNIGNSPLKSKKELKTRTVVGGGDDDGGLADGEPDTLYQCSLCQQIFHDYALLQTHCLEHASAVANHGVPGAADDEQHIITYIAAKENTGQPSDGDQITVQVASDGTVDLQSVQQHQQQQQFVIVYDHGDEGSLPNVVEMQQ